MKEQLISFDIAKLAKEKGFNEDGQINIDSIPNCYRSNGVLNDSDYTGYYPAPTQALLQKWLREVHNIHIKVDDFLDNDNKTDWDYEVVFIGTDINEKGEYIAEIPYDCDRSYITYEEALEKGLQEALKLI